MSDCLLQNWIGHLPGPCRTRWCTFPKSFLPFETQTPNSRISYVLREFDADATAVWSACQHSDWYPILYERFTGRN
jgi:hypothetical protein